MRSDDGFGEAMLPPRPERVLHTGEGKTLMALDAGELLQILEWEDRGVRLGGATPRPALVVWLEKALALVSDERIVRLASDEDEEEIERDD